MSDYQMLLNNYATKINNVSSGSSRRDYRRIESLLYKLDLEFAGDLGFLNFFDSMIDDYCDPVNVDHAKNSIVKIILTEAESISPAF